jgi:hypothetical protein
MAAGWVLDWAANLEPLALTNGSGWTILREKTEPDSVAEKMLWMYCRTTKRFR